MNKTLKIILIVLGSIFLISIIMKAVFKREDSVKVKIEKVEKRSISETVSANGKIQPEVDVKISSQVSGQIVELPVKEGDLVEKGDLLLKINPDIYEASFNRANASLNNTKSNLANAKAMLSQSEARFVASELSYNRNNELFNQGAISQADWDNAVASYEVSKSEVVAAKESVKAAEYSIMSANASLSEARDNLSRTTILAPKSGTITALTKELGESVLGNNMMAGEVIMNVSDLNSMEVDVEVNESDIIRVHVGDSVDIEVDAFNDKTFKGLVTEIGNTAKNASGSSLDAVTNFSVKVRILEDSYKSYLTENTLTAPFRPGMSANVEIKTESFNDVICVPIKAVSIRSDTSRLSKKSIRRFDTDDESEESDDKFECVVVVNEIDNTVELRVIKTGIQDIDYIQLLDGLEVGETVVIWPYRSVKGLRTGESISIENEDEEDE